MTEKHLIITGTSLISWKDAIVKAVNEAAETIDYISSIKILDQRANINGNKISEYFVDIDLSFVYIISLLIGFSPLGEKLLRILSHVRPLETKQEYSKYVDKKSPNSPILKNCFNAFLVGGLICSIGQIISEICKFNNLDIQLTGTIVSIILIGISAFLTALNIFNKIGKFAGAGSLVPITGFANSIVSPAMEYKSEGYVMGVGAKMFTVAGPVLVYGISASVLIGIIATFFV